MKHMKRFLPAVVGISTFLSMTSICTASTLTDEDEKSPVKVCASSSGLSEHKLPGMVEHPFYQKLFSAWSPDVSAKMKIGILPIVRAQQDGCNQYAIQLFLLNSFEHDLYAKTLDQHTGLVSFEKILEKKDTQTTHFAILFAASLSVIGTNDYPGMLKLLKAATKVPATYGLQSPMPLREIIMGTVLRAVPGDMFHESHQKQHAKRAKLIKKTVKKHTEKTTDTLLTLYANMDSKVFYERMLATQQAQKEKERLSSPIFSSESVSRPTPSSSQSAPVVILQSESTTRPISTQPTLDPAHDQQDDMPALIPVVEEGVNEKDLIVDENLTS